MALQPGLALPLRAETWRAPAPHDPAASWFPLREPEGLIKLVTELQVLFRVGGFQVLVSLLQFPEKGLRSPPHLTSSQPHPRRKGASAGKPADLPVQALHGVLKVFQVLWETPFHLWVHLQGVSLLQGSRQEEGRLKTPWPVK